jgi:prephenate dehydratase
MTRVAIQGIPGSYSEEAAMQFFGGQVEIVECRDFDEVFEMIENGGAENAVVPVENKIVGAIKRPNELINGGGFKMLDSIKLNIEHVLVAAPGTDFEDIARVRSHPEAIKQCKDFFTANARLAAVDCRDTASGIKEIVAEAVPTNAAIGSRRAAEMYGAVVLKEGIADERDNWTKFYLIGR